MFSRFSHPVGLRTLALATALIFGISPIPVEAQTDGPPRPINVGAPVRKVSYQRSVRPPSWQQVAGARATSQPTMIEEVGPGEIVGDVHYQDRVMMHNHGQFMESYDVPGCSDGFCGDEVCGAGDCGGCGHGYDGERFNYCAGLLFENLEISAGVASFKGPLDFGRNGNFGFQYGANLGLPLLPHWGIGGQIGVRGVTVNHEGYDIVGYQEDTRDQVFSTIGIFHHATDCNPWSWGVVFDQLHDEYWDEFDFAQVRAELGYVTKHCNEFGVMTAVSTKTSEGRYLSQPEFSFETHDQYAFYVRRYLCNDGEIRGWAGFTADGSGIVGGDFAIPISDRFAFEANFNYLIPDDGESPAQDQEAEAWAIGLNLVWHTRPGAYAHRKNPYRAMFSVADNASMMRRLID